MVTYNQFVKGIHGFIKEEMPTSNAKFGLDFALRMLVNNKESTMKAVKNRLGIVLDVMPIIVGDDIDIDIIYQTAKETLNGNPYRFDTPLGCITVTPSDLDRAYQKIISS